MRHCASKLFVASEVSMYNGHPSKIIERGKIDIPNTEVHGQTLQ
jgi:hypothetical protein